LAEETIEGWLTDSYDYERPRRGQVREGVILRVEENSVIIDVGLKRDGIVPQKDVERLGEEASAKLQPGQEVSAYVLQPEDRDGNLVLSLSRAQMEEDWKRAEELLESGEIWRGEISGYNKGGLTVKFGRIRGFVPGSHLWERDRRRLSPEQRKEAFSEYMGQELPLKLIEVDRGKRRLVLSERQAQRQLKKDELKRLLEDLQEGQVVRGTVRHITDFGAFVDLGGADGLIHVSELAWQKVRHPSDVLDVGDELQVYVLRLDHKRKRIGLSLKRLQPDPWSWVELTYSEGELVAGVITGIADFGAFVALDIGVEGLVHISEISDPPPDHPRDAVRRGEQVVVRILDIEAHRRRIGLSLKRVSEEEREEVLRSAEAEQTAETVADEEEAAAEEPAIEEPVSEGSPTEASMADDEPPSAPAREGALEDERETQEAPTGELGGEKTPETVADEEEAAAEEPAIEEPVSEGSPTEASMADDEPPSAPAREGALEDERETQEAPTGELGGEKTPESELTRQEAPTGEAVPENASTQEPSLGEEEAREAAVGVAETMISSVVD
jgi:small subunit ribosomal protein S1